MKLKKANSRTFNPRKLAKIATRGPAAWGVASDHGRILAILAAEKKPFVGLRRTAYIMAVSHHTLLGWEKRGLIVRVRSRAGGEHPKFRVSDLTRMIELMRDRDLDYPSPISRLGKCRAYPFDILAGSSFAWPRSERALTPKGIAERAGCHPSTIIRAIVAGRVKGKRRSPKRWEIRRADWDRAFPFSLRNAK